MMRGSDRQVIEAGLPVQFEEFAPSIEGERLCRREISAARRLGQAVCNLWKNEGSIPFTRFRSA